MKTIIYSRDAILTHGFTYDVLWNVLWDLGRAITGDEWDIDDWIGATYFDGMEVTDRGQAV